jgi:2-oxoglutarate ferredoxin oxidoreductase subunit gamma
MTETIIIAGAGGQGIMLLGKVLAQAAMHEHEHVTWMPAYGAEVRGGTAHCMVVVSDEEISNPYIEKADTLIIMNELSFLRFRSHIKTGGLMIMNSSLVEEKSKINRVSCVWHPFTDIAYSLGNIKIANMVALGSYAAHKKTVSVDSVMAAMREIAPKDAPAELLAVNIKALVKGKELA